MRVRQYAYLKFASNSLDPARITALIGVEADQERQRGSRFAGPPPVPRSHLWFMKSGVTDEATLNDHLDALFPRLVQASDGIKAVTADGDTFGVLTNVRHFEEGEEAFDEATYGVRLPGIERVPGQHPFLGWGLDQERITPLTLLGVGLDVDEYG